MAAILIQTTAAISPALALVKVCTCFAPLSPFFIPGGITTFLDSASVCHRGGKRNWCLLEIVFHRKQLQGLMGMEQNQGARCQHRGHLYNTQEFLWGPSPVTTYSFLLRSSLLSLHQSLSGESWNPSSQCFLTSFYDWVDFTWFSVTNIQDVSTRPHWWGFSVKV